MILPKIINFPIQVGESRSVRGGDLFLKRCEITKNDWQFPFHQISCHKMPVSEVMKLFPFFI